jgi:GTP-binding protein
MDTMQSAPTVAIVGRPNVGKSSLFNSIIKKRLAIVHHESGVTRDRIVSPAHWRGKHFQVVDTGGLGTYTEEKKNVDMWDKAIREQVTAAIEGADILFFVTDIQAGISPLDEEIAILLRNSQKSIFLVINKVDNKPLEDSAAIEFASLGFENTYYVSSLHRRGIDDLLTDSLKTVPLYKKPDEKEEPFRMAIMGRPNVGKSSLTNRLLGEKRVMVSEVAGTTRDSIDIEFSLEYDDESRPVVIIDTAGLRKRSKVKSAIEKFSVMRAQDAIDRSQLILFVVEAEVNGVTAQDKKIAQMIHDSGKGCIILANKWDKCEGKKKEVAQEIRRTLPFMNYAPLIFTCALSGLNFNQVLNDIAEVREQMELSISTSMVNQVITDATARTAPPVVGTKPLKIYYGTMKANEPPRFILFVNDPKLCAKNYLNYLINYFRKAFVFTGLPIRIILRKRPRK